MLPALQPQGQTLASGLPFPGASSSHHAWPWWAVTSQVKLGSIHVRHCQFTTAVGGMAIGFWGGLCLHVFRNRARQYRRSARRQHQSRHGRSVVVTHSKADSWQSFLSAEVPELATVASVAESLEGGGFGLFATKALNKGQTLLRVPIDSKLVIEPIDSLSGELQSGDFGAIAFQLLSAIRAQDLQDMEISAEQARTWTTWKSTGVQAPVTHPLQLALAEPQLAQHLWNSTTCGQKMSDAALDVNADVQLLEGKTNLNEWAALLALVKSRCVVEDKEKRPILVLGLDLLQDGELPNVMVEVQYEQGKGGFFGLGANDADESRIEAIVLKARADIGAGDELTMSYKAKPQCAGMYIEQYGFVPQRFGSELADGTICLAFAPTDEEVDEEFFNKRSIMEDVGMSTRPLDFFFSSQQILTFPVEGIGWDEAGPIEKLCQMLRLRHINDKDCFLLDTVYQDRVWGYCTCRISAINETNVCTSVIDECERWLNRLEDIAEVPPASNTLIAKFLAEVDWVRQHEIEVLITLQGIFKQERNDTETDKDRRYWVDREMDVAFPARAAIERGDYFDWGDM